MSKNIKNRTAEEPKEKPSSSETPEEAPDEPEEKAPPKETPDPDEELEKEVEDISFTDGTDITEEEVESGALKDDEAPEEEVPEEEPG